jgi:hypothetical protein
MFTQRESAPGPGVYQMMSSRPLPSKSPAKGRYWAPFTVAGVTVCPPLRSNHQTESAALPGPYQKMSSTPSPSRSPTTGR